MLLGQALVPEPSDGRKSYPSRFRITRAFPGGAAFWNRSLILPDGRVQTAFESAWIIMPGADGLRVHETFPLRDGSTLYAVLKPRIFGIKRPLELYAEQLTVIPANG